jgi:ATP-binding cassette subfamily C protein
VKLFRELRFILNRREKIEGTALLCGMAVGALLEAAGVSLVVPFLGILKNPDLVFRFSAVSTLFRFLDIHGPRQILITIAFGMIVLFVMKTGFLVLLYRWQFQYIFAVYVRLGKRLLTGYLNAPYVFHLQRNSSELIKATTESVQRFAGGYLLSLLTVLGEALVVLAVGILLTMVEPLATLGAIIVLGVPTAIIYRAMHRRLAVSGRLAEQSLAATIQWIEQGITGIKETLVTGSAQFFVDRYGYQLSRVAEGVRTFSLLSTIPRLLIDTLAVSAMVIVVLILLARGQNLQAVLPILTIFAVAALRLLPSTSRIANALAQLRFHYAAAEVVYKELVQTHHNGVSQLLRPPTPRLKHSLVVHRLSYRYPSAPRYAIHDVSLEIPRGHWVALIGPTGAGKTTLVDLLLGLLVPTAGNILLDGRDLGDNPIGWQRMIGLVPQSIYLLDDTIRRNIGFGFLDEEIDDQEIWRALHDAKADQLVRSLPGGLDAIIGERGDRISGGERQRLGIARALYRNPEVLIFDEGTAHLDNETERSIGDTLAALRGEKTIIMIAHRMALVRKCDRIFILEQGRVRTSGTYSDLVSEDLMFRNFASDAP